MTISAICTLTNIVCIGILIGCAYCTAEFCGPYKRRMEKMLDTILSYQRKQGADMVSVPYKGKMFDVSVYMEKINASYYQYQVDIRGKHVNTLHVLEHAFSKSREIDNYGKMRAYENHDIIKAAYKKIKKEERERFNQEWEESSYFN